MISRKNIIAAVLCCVVVLFVQANQINQLFDLSTLGSITLSISAEEWDRLLSNFDENKRNDEYVMGDFLLEKGNLHYDIRQVGIRVRGNTSRKRPEGEKGEIHSSEDPKYRHVHFKVSFDEFVKDASHSIDNGKLEQLNLKWFKDDGMYVREIYSYDLFRRFGVWTAPRAAYTKLYLKIGEEETVYYGIYAMIEDINKEYLEARVAPGKFRSDHGDLWKCLYPASLTVGSLVSMGNKKNNAQQKRNAYYLSTNKKKYTEPNGPKERFTEFVTELNQIPDKKFKSWIRQRMDVKLFLKTYAVNVAVGMWDDYWVNSNNFYLYMDTNGKVFFIPYDYDNTLGTSLILEDAGKQNPLQWGPEKGKPLINRILAVKEYQKFYLDQLKELINPKKDLFYVEKSQERIRKWQEMISPYLANVTGEHMELVDIPAWWAKCHFYRLLEGDEETNFFLAKTKSIEDAHSQR